MKRKIFIIVLLTLLLITGCKKEVPEVKNDKSKDKEVISFMKMTINNEEYQVKLDSNEATNQLLDKLPLELEMDELNGNEKYTYLDFSLTTNEYNPKTINKGDVMLFGNNCLVIFYKNFNTSYSYTKIGHIDNLKDLGTEKITIRIEK